MRWSASISLHFEARMASYSILHRIDTLDKLGVALAEHEALLISNRPAPKPPASSKKSVVEPYNKTLNYWGYAADVPRAFLKFYTFVFSLAKAP